LDTQVMVIQRSIIGRARSCANVSVIGRSTIPSMRNCQVSASTCGTRKAMSTR
jgi:hypothetical protein